MGSGVPPDRYILLAWSGQTELAAFLCLDPNPHPRWGMMVDNLHVRPDRKGQSLGRRLLSEGGKWLEARWPDLGVHLWALEQNEPACRFYSRLGGAMVERAMRRIADGNNVPANRYYWKSPALLANPRSTSEDHGPFPAANKD
ncbi:MAG: GNAT family N-acetyltransferase [Acidobacteriaceae bacterium]|nr:GNAT family N-acetyltransferase [Acidobacteriaceae bacterium]